MSAIRRTSLPAPTPSSLVFPRLLPQTLVHERVSHPGGPQTLRTLQAYKLTTQMPLHTSSSTSHHRQQLCPSSSQVRNLGYSSIFPFPFTTPHRAPHAVGSPVCSNLMTLSTLSASIPKPSPLQRHPTQSPAPHTVNPRFLLSSPTFLKHRPITSHPKP